MEKMLLTGVTGFLGRNFMESLDRNKYEVFAVGRNCPPFMDREHFFVTDLKDPAGISEVIERISPDVLVLFAWDVSTQSYWETLENCVWANICIQTAEVFLENEGRQILFAGTSASYDYGKGFLKELPEYEHPSSLYGISKLYTSQVLCKLAKRYDALYCEARIFAIYGKYEKRNRLIPLTAWRLSQNEKIVNTCGELQRDYIYIGDAVNAIHLLLETKATGVYNISSGKPVSIGRIVMQVAEELGKPDLIEFDNSNKTDDSPLIVGDNAKLEDLGFVSAYSLEIGIRQTLDWMMKEGKL